MLGTFAERMRYLRLGLGSRGSGTSVRQWAKDLGVTHGKARAWEEGFFPRRGIVELTQVFKRFPAIEARGLEAGRLAAWTYTGEGDPPLDPPPAAAALKPSQSDVAPSSPELALDQARTPWKVILKFSDLAVALEEAEAKGGASAGEIRDVLIKLDELAAELNLRAAGNNAAGTGRSWPSDTACAGPYDTSSTPLTPVQAPAAVLVGPGVALGFLKATA